jgi:hypothetical protein
MVNLADAVFGETAALEAGGVQSIGVGVAGGDGFGKGQHVAGDSGAAANEGVGTDANKMVHRAKRAHRGPFFHDDMASQSCGVGEDNVVADHAVMGHVGVGHDQGVIADAGEASTLGGAAIDGDKFADGVIVADFKARRFAFVTQVLRGESDRRKRKKAIARANRCGPFDGDMRDEFATFAEFDICANCAIGPNFAGGVNLRAGFDDCGAVNGHFEMAVL